MTTPNQPGAGNRAPITAGSIIEAFEALGVAGISFPAPITRHGPGWLADVDLPCGVTVAGIVEHCEHLAASLGLPAAQVCVWPSPDRLILWLADTERDYQRGPG